MLELENEWLLKFKPIIEGSENGNIDDYEKLKKEIEIFFNCYKNNLFLFASDRLDSTNYEITNIPLENLRYFKHIEDVITQNEASKLHWVNFFHS